MPRLILECQFAIKIEYFSIIDFFFPNYIVDTWLIFLCKGE